jgi:hypothetical protein
MSRSFAKRKVNQGSWWSGIIVLPFRPNSHFTVVLDLDMNDVRRAAYGTILNVLLLGPCREVDGDNDFFPAGIADVAGLAFHLRLGLRSFISIPIEYSVVVEA